MDMFLPFRYRANVYSCKYNGVRVSSTYVIYALAAIPSNVGPLAKSKRMGGMCCGDRYDADLP